MRLAGLLVALALALVAGPALAAGDTLTAGGTVTYATVPTGYGQVLSGGYGTTGATIPYGVASIEARVTRNGAPSSPKVAIGENQFGYIGVNASGYAISSCGSTSMTSTKSITDNATHSVRLDMGPTGCTLYVDGASVATTAMVYAPTTAPSAFAVGDFGGLVGSTFTWGGTVDEVAVWGVTKGATVASSPYTGAEPNLIALYHLDGALTDSAAAGAQVQNTNAVFSHGPVAASAAPGALFATTGWADNSGNAWSLAAPNGIPSATLVSTVASPWINATLLRPTAEMRTGGVQQEDATVEYYANSASAYPACSYVPGSPPQFYFGGISISGGVPSLAIGKYYSSTLTTGLATSAALSLTASTAYDIRLRCDRTSTSQTVISVALYTTAGAQIGSAVDYVATDAGLQNVNSGLGYFGNNATPGYTLPVISITTALSGAATSYSFWGPATGATGAANTFGLSANGVPAGSTPLSLSDGGAGGAFSALTLTPSTPYGTTTYTPALNGPATLSVSSGGLLTNPPSDAFTGFTYMTIPVSSTAFKFSPLNWTGDMGRSGNAYRQTWNNGANFEVDWQASANPATATLLIPATSSGNVISYIYNGVLTDNVSIANGNLTFTPVAGAANQLIVIQRNAPQTARWGQASAAGNTFQVQGLQIDNGSQPLAAPAARPCVLAIGDSISDGVQADGASADNWLHDYMYYLRTALDQVRSPAAPAGYDFGMSGAGFSGWIEHGDSPGGSSGDIPGYCIVSGGVCGASSRIGLIDAAVSMLDANGMLSCTGTMNSPPAALVGKRRADPTFRSLA